MDPMVQLAHRVATKIEEGDFRGAIRLASSDDTLADFNEDTFSALQAKHPLPHPNSQIPPAPAVPSFPEDFEISQQDIARAIRSFPCGSAGGPDRLRPQHLKDLVQLREDTSENQLLSALVDFCYLVLRGDTPDVVRPFFLVLPWWP